MAALETHDWAPVPPRGSVLSIVDGELRTAPVTRECSRCGLPRNDDSIPVLREWRKSGDVIAYRTCDEMVVHSVMES